QGPPQSVETRAANGGGLPPLQSSGPGPTSVRVPDQNESSTALRCRRSCAEPLRLRHAELCRVLLFELPFELSSVASALRFVTRFHRSQSPLLQSRRSPGTA